MNDVNQAVILLEGVEKRLSEVRTLVDALDLIRDATLAESLAKAVKLGKEAENHAHAVWVTAQYKAGQMLRQNPPNQYHGNRFIGSNSISHPTLEDAGITRQQSSRWQRMADLPPDEFEALREEKESQGERLTVSGVMQEAERFQLNEMSPDEELEAQRRVAHFMAEMRTDENGRIATGNGNTHPSAGELKQILADMQTGLDRLHQLEATLQFDIATRSFFAGKYRSFADDLLFWIDEFEGIVSEY